MSVLVESETEPAFEAPVATQDHLQLSNNLLPRTAAPDDPASVKQVQLTTVSDVGILSARDDDTLSDVSHQTSTKVLRTSIPLVVDERPITFPPAQSDGPQNRGTPITADDLHRRSSQNSSEPDLHNTPQMVAEKLSARMAGYADLKATASHQEQGLEELRDSLAQMQTALLKCYENQEKIMEMVRPTGVPPQGARVHGFTVMEVST